MLFVLPVTSLKLWSVKASPQSSDTDRMMTSGPPTTMSCLLQKHGEKNTLLVFYVNCTLLNFYKFIKHRHVNYPKHIL